jgi:bifunctional non-homologous end joining protein LigD
VATETQPQEVSVDGHNIELKKLDKVMYPKTGFTKAGVLDYYSRIADVMLPHLRDRPVTLKRYPGGVEGEMFFEKACPKYRPSWIPTVGRYAESRHKTTEYCVVNDRASLIWLANIATLEFHVPLALKRSKDRPRSIVFDLDPGPGTDSVDCGKIAMILRERLSDDGLEALIKTSGSKGIHLYVPLNKPRMTFDRSKAYAHKVAEELMHELPDDVTANMKKTLREGRVFIDWSQNSTHKTTVCAYSLRGREEPTASAPITWDELREAVKAKDASQLIFSSDEVLERVEKHGDLLADVLTIEQTLPRV